MTYRPKTDLEIASMRESGKILSAVLEEAYEAITVGMSLKEIDTLIHKLILSHDAEPSFLGYHNFPAASCLSVNDAVVHGIPTDYVLQDGDTLGVDVGVKFQNYHTDAAFTAIVGKKSFAMNNLLAVTQEALKIGVEAAVAGNVVSDIGSAIERYVKSQGQYGIVRDLAGHGIGQKLQESPQILNYNNNDNTKLINGMTLAIEPMITTGSWQVYVDQDNWTVKTQDQSQSCQFETTILVNNTDPEVLVPFPLDPRIVK